MVRVAPSFLRGFDGQIDELASVGAEIGAAVGASVGLEAVGGWVSSCPHT